MGGRPGGLRRGPLPRAAFVLAAGFLALCLFWLADRHHGRGPGLADFASATWGDGVLLPVQAHALGLLAERLPSPARPPRLWPATLAGAVAGAAVAATTLLDPAAPPDWTMPAPHHPTAAGLWHCGFIVAAAALFARWWCDALLRLRPTHREGLRTGLIAVLAIALTPAARTRRICGAPAPSPRR